MVKLHGAVLPSLSDYPSNPAEGRLAFVNNILHVYTEVDGFDSWYPVTNRTKRFVQARPINSSSWTIIHNLNSTSLQVFAYDNNGAIIIPSNISYDNANQVTLTFSQSYNGHVVIYIDFTEQLDSIAEDAGKLDGLDSTQFLRSDANTGIDSDRVFDVGSGEGALRFQHNSAGNVTTITPYDGGQWASDKQLLFDADVGDWQIEGQSIINGLVGYAPTDDGTAVDADARFGRNADQYISLHGHAAGNAITAKSTDGNTKDFLIKVRNDTTTQEYRFACTNGKIKVNGNEVWHAGNDGSGSGLNADTVDGIEAASFLRSDANDTMANTLTITGGLRIERTDPNIQFEDTDGVTDAKKSKLFWYQNGFLFRTLNDDDSTKTQLLELGEDRFNYKSGKVWHEGNDGSGSGLNADLLDGNEASAFVLSSALTDYSINPRFNNAIGLGNDSEVIKFNDATNQTRTGYWDTVDGFEIRGDSNLQANVVVQTGNLELTQNAWIEGILGVGTSINIDGDDVLPIPDQTGNSGKVLGTDGSDLSWVDGGTGSYSASKHETTISTASNTVTLPWSATLTDIAVYIDGVRQLQEAYSVSGTTLTMDEELPVGTKVCVIQVDDTYLDTVAYSDQAGYTLEDNLLINGGFDKFSYATYVDDPTSSAEYNCADRWRCRRSNNATGARFGRSSVNPPTSAYSFYMRRSSGNSNTNAFALQQQIESRTLYPFVGKKVTVSFKLYTDSGWDTRWGTSTIKLATGTTTNESIEIGDTATGEVTLINSETISKPGSTETWTEYSFTSSVAIPTNATCMYLKFLFGVTGTAAADEVLRIAEVKLEPGETATPWKNRPFPLEQDYCRRYYQCSGTDTEAQPLFTAEVGSGNSYYLHVPFKTRMRVTPTVSGTRQAEVNMNGTFQLQGGDNTAFRMRCDADGTGRGLCRFTWQADAEL